MKIQNNKVDTAEATAATAAASNENNNNQITFKYNGVLGFISAVSRLWY